MKYLRIFFVIYGLKILYDLLMWLYGYFLRIKWISYYNKNKKSALSYTFQIRNYLTGTPLGSYIDEVFPSYNPEHIYKIFIEHHGYYRHKFFQNFNPFYWIELVVFLPQKVLLYLNPRFKKKTLNIFNFIFWICSVAYTIYNEEIIQFVKEFIKLLFEYFKNK